METKYSRRTVLSYTAVVLGAAALPGGTKALSLQGPALAVFIRW